MTNFERVPYDEFSYFHENAEEFNIPWNGPPIVRRVSVDVEPSRSLSALVWGDGDPEIVRKQVGPLGRIENRGPRNPFLGARRRER